MIPKNTARVLKRVNGLAREGGLVQAGQVPDVEIGDPQRQRDERMDEEAQPPHHRQAEERLKQRPGHTEHDQKRADVRHQQVLGHVAQEELLAQVRGRGDERGEHEHHAAGEAELSGQRDRPALGAEGPGSQRVADYCQRRRQELERFPGTAATWASGTTIASEHRVPRSAPSSGYAAVAATDGTCSSTSAASFSLSWYSRRCIRETTRRCTWAVPSKIW